MKFAYLKLKACLFNLAICLLIVATNGPIALAENATEPEVFDLSLGQLMGVKIVTATKEEQSIEEAPAIIDVITASRIRDFGANSLYELFSYLPGIEVMETYFGRTVLQFRGVMNIHYSNKVLLMINGKPFYEPVNGSSFLEAIPVSSISRIEIIRGPGSSLYGTNAYSGVINVITKTGTDDKEPYTAEFEYGSFDSFKGALSGQAQITDKLSLFVSGEVFNSDGYEFNVEADERGNSADIDYADRGARFFVNATYEDFSFDLGYYMQDKRAYGIVPVVNYSGIFERRGFYANATMKHDFSEDLSTSLTLRYHKHSSPDGNIGQFPVPGFGGHEPSDVHLDLGGDVGAIELQANYRFSDALTNVTGFAYESQNSDEYYFVWDSDGAIHPFSAYLDSQDSYNIAAYTQFSYKFTDRFSTVTGLRAVDDKDVEDAFFLPRIGMVYKITEDLFAKALYGAAFRAPTFFEKYVSTYNVLYGSADLDPEEIDTVDLALEYKHQDSLKVRLNGFIEWTTDGVTRVPTLTPDLHGPNSAIYTNSAEEEIYGVEFSLESIFADNGYYGFNFTYKEGEDDNTGATLRNFANLTSNAWLHYRFCNNFFITPSLQYIGDRKGELVSNERFTVSDYFLANFVLGYTWKDFTFTLSAKNLLDEDYTYPEYVRHNIEEIPGGAGRSFFGGIRYQY